VIEMEDGADMTRAEMLKFNPRWSAADRSIVSEELDRLGATGFTYRQKGYNIYVEVASATGQTLMHVSKGTMYFGDNAPDRPGVHDFGDDKVLRLSTYRAGGGARAEKATGDTCPRCFQQMSLTGECGNCD